MALSHNGRWRFILLVTSPVPSGKSPLCRAGGDCHLLGGRDLHRAGDSAAAEPPSGLRGGREREAGGRLCAAVEELDAAAQHLPHSSGINTHALYRHTQ